MKRVFVVVTLVLSCMAGPLGADAQSLAPVPRIGVLRFAGAVGSAQFMASFRQGLRELGYVEGKNIAIEWRFADESSGRAAELASELVRLRVVLIVASGTPAGEAASKATRRIPVVLTSAADAVASGLVASPARPGGNVTGLSLSFPETAGKQMDWLRQILPGVTRVALLASTSDLAVRLFVEETQRAGERFGIRVQVLMVGGADELDGAFAAMRREEAGAVIIQPILVDYIQRIVELATRDRLPTFSFRRDFSEAGVLMTYGPDLRETWRGAAIYVDKILKGAKPRDLPVTEPAKYELDVNLKTAKALGITIPQSVLGRADQMIH